jgi:hypothetical protein
MVLKQANASLLSPKQSPLLQGKQAIQALSHNSLNWLQSILSGVKVPPPPLPVANELKEFVSTGSYPNLYRVLGYGHSKRPNGNWVVGTHLALNFETPTCWTVSENIARDYGVKKQQYWVIAKLSNASNSQAICDTRMLPDSVRTQVMDTDYREVILQQGTFTAEIIDIGRGEKAGLHSITEWRL